MATHLQITCKVVLGILAAALVKLFLLSILDKHTEDQLLRCHVSADARM